MGFPGKNTKKTDTPAAPRTTVIAAGTTLVGDVELKDNFHLDGNMEGSLVSQADVAIGRSGRFKGNITAKRVLISGVLDGKVDADRLEIVASGQVTGEIRVREFVIESGGQFVGASQVKKHDNKPAPLRAVEGEKDASQTQTQNQTQNQAPQAQGANASSAVPESR